MQFILFYDYMGWGDTFPKNNVYAQVFQLSL